jgi:23S rRNA pseudouridine2605 synthase
MASSKGGKKSTSGDQKKSPRGGKNQVVGTSRTGKPVTKKQYIDRKKSESTPKKKSADDSIRLNKYIANSGVCSRRDADVYIQAGSVTVNGKAVTQMGYKVQPNDEVRFDNRLLTPARKEYFLLNKPKGFITPKKGERASKTVLDLMANASPSKLHFVGSLNRSGLGLMLFTNDLEMANKLNNPNRPIRQMYQVALDRSFKHEDLVALRKGILIEGKPVKIHDANYIEGGRNNEIGVELSSGKDNIILHIFDTLGYEIKILDRVMLAGLTKKDLPRGNYRLLSQQEIINLKML